MIGWSRAARQGVVFAITCVLTVLHTWPLARVWRSELLGGRYEDPWMNLWHIDWMRRSLLAGKSPFFTEALHHPLGAELYWHTLAPAKSVLGALLLPWLGPVASFNLVVATTFVLTGMTAFWLCADRLRTLDLPPRTADACALVGACVFNFSRYHLAHAVAHVNLAALEGIPLFLLGFFRAIEGGKRRWALLAGLAAGYVALCDFYYVYYLALFAVAWMVLRIWDDSRIFSRDVLRRDDVARALMVAGVSAVASLPALLPLLLHLHPAPIGYHHGDSEYPADLLSPLLPDHLSVWNAQLPALLRVLVNRMQREMLNDAEGGCFVGLVAPALAILAVYRRTPDSRRHLSMLFGFAVLSLGVYLGIGGLEVHPPVVALALLALLFVPLRPETNRARDLRVLLLLVLAASPLLHLTAYGEPVRVRIPMPFMLFKEIVPLFGRGGMPVRFLLLSQLSLALLAAHGAAWLLRRSKHRPLWVATPLLLAVNLETASRPFPTTKVEPLAAILAPITTDTEPGIGVYTDHVLGQWEETVHHKPVSIARQSRLPAREQSLYDSPLRRYLADPKHMDDPADDAQVAELRALLEAARYKYFVAHAVTTRFGDYPLELQRARAALLERLGAVCLHADAERQIYRFW